MLTKQIFKLPNINPKQTSNTLGGCASVCVCMCVIKKMFLSLCHWNAVGRRQWMTNSPGPLGHNGINLVFHLMFVVMVIRTYGNRVPFLSI